MTTIAQAALKQVGAEALTLIINKPLDPAADNAVVIIPISDGVFSTGTSGTYKNVSFKAVIAQSGGISIEENLSSSGQLIGPSEFKISRVAIDADEDWAPLLPGYIWNGQIAEIYIGARYRADGSPMLLSEFDRYDVIIEKLRSLGDMKFEIVYSDPRIRLRKRHSGTFYRGFGGGLAIRTTVSPSSDRVWLSSAHNASLDSSGDITLGWIGTIDSLASTETPMIMNGGLTDMNYGLLTGPGGSLSFGSATERITSSYTATAGDQLVFFAVVDSSGNVSLYAGVNGDDVAIAGTGTLSAPISSGSTAGVFVGIDGGADMTPYEIFIRNVPSNISNILEYSNGPLLGALTDGAIVEAWKFGEGSELGAGPDIVFGEKGVHNFQNAGTGTPQWASSYEGDDPEQFPGSLAGQYRSVVYGPVKNVQLSRIDSQRDIYGWDSVSSNSLSRLRQRGLPMVPGHSVSASAIGDLVFDASSKTVTISAPSVGSFSPFIAGQEKPFRLGQRVKVSGTSSNNKIFRVAVNGISSSGLVMSLADNPVVSESAPSSASIVTYSNDLQYAADLSRSVVDLNGVQAVGDPGDIAGDITGRLPVSATSTWTDLFELITGVAPETTNVTLDPEIGFSIENNSEISTNEILDQMAVSSGGWWVEDGQGGYRLGTHALPSGGATTVITPSDVLSIESLESPEPFWKFNIGHSKNWHVQGQDSLAGSLSQSDKQVLSTEFTYLPCSDISVLELHPDAEEFPDTIETWLTNRSDAEQLKQILSAILTQKLRWFKISIGDLRFLDALLYDVVNVTYDDTSLALSNSDCRIVGRVIDLSDYSMEFTVFTT